MNYYYYYYYRILNQKSYLMDMHHLHNIAECKPCLLQLRHTQYRIFDTFSKHRLNLRRGQLKIIHNEHVRMHIGRVQRMLLVQKPYQQQYCYSILEQFGVHFLSPFGAGFPVIEAQARWNPLSQSQTPSVGFIALICSYPKV